MTGPNPAAPVPEQGNFASFNPNKLCARPARERVGIDHADGRVIALTTALIQIEQLALKLRATLDDATFAKQSKWVEATNTPGPWLDTECGSRNRAARLVVVARRPSCRRGIKG